jgi:diacylglycerol kinase family enzyme
VHLDGGEVVDDGYLTIVMNTNPYTYLGNRPLNLAPEATLDRGLATVTLRSMAFGHTMRVIGSVLLGSGRAFRRSRRVDRRTDLDHLVVKGYGPIPYQVDGDYLGDVEELRFRHEPEVLDLVLPLADPDA